MSHPVDIYVGKRLRLRRNMEGLSQEDMAKAVGITFQQIQKYERGVNRMSASRLFEFAGVLKVSIAYFFEGLEPFATVNDPYNITPSLSEAEPAGFEHEDMLKRETLEMMRSYYRLSQPVRKRISDLIRAVAEDKALEPEA